MESLIKDIIKDEINAKYSRRNNRKTKLKKDLKEASEKCSASEFELKLNESVQKLKREVRESEKRLQKEFKKMINEAVNREYQKIREEIRLELTGKAEKIDQTLSNKYATMLNLHQLVLGWKLCAESKGYPIDVCYDLSGGKHTKQVKRNMSINGKFDLSVKDSIPIRRSSSLNKKIDGEAGRKTRNIT